MPYPKNAERIRAMMARAEPEGEDQEQYWAKRLKNAELQDAANEANAELDMQREWENIDARYQISDSARVWDTYEGREVQQMPHDNGTCIYLEVGVLAGTRRVHVLVAAAFPKKVRQGPCKAGRSEIDHDDNNAFNCAVWNLVKLDGPANTAKMYMAKAVGAAEWIRLGPDGRAALVTHWDENGRDMKKWRAWYDKTVQDKAAEAATALEQLQRDHAEARTEIDALNKET